MFQDEEQVQFCKDVAEEARKQLETRVITCDVICTTDTCREACACIDT